MRARATSAGKYLYSGDGNTFRSFQPKSGFKRDRREGGQAPRKQGDGVKHINLKALRNNGDPLRSDKGKRPINKRFQKKGKRFNKNQNRNEKKDPATIKDALDRQME